MTPLTWREGKPMAFAEGNQFWRMRASSGAPRKYETPEALAADCEEYFSKRDAMEMNKQPLPYTLASLCLFLDITQETWRTWASERGDLSAVITRVDETIRDQKMVGAMVGSYNHNIVARDLGLVDKIDTKSTVKHEIPAADKLRDFLTNAKPG
jgi:hypothetical protein